MAESSVADTTAPVVELFWMAGCSACLRMKEFVEQSDVPYDAINLETSPERAEKLKAHGLLVPAACVGDRCVDGHNLGEVADLIGVEYDRREILPPDELYQRYRRFNGALCQALSQMTDEALDYTFPNREMLWPESEVEKYGVANRRRTVLELSNHASLLVRAFLSAYGQDHYDIAIYRTPRGLGEISSVDEVVKKASETLRMLDDWWEEDGQDDLLDHVLDTVVGYRTLHEILEREVWHTAHHVRQLNHVLELHGIDPDVPLTEDDLRGLPTPQRIHE